MSGSLTHSPANIIRYLLISEGLGTLPTDSGSWPVYYSNEPGTPDSVITLYDTAGRIDGHSQIDGRVIEHHGIQVRVRCANPENGYAKARAIAVALDEDVSFSGVTISTSTYTVYAVTRSSDVLSLGKETPTSKRNLFTVNATVALRQTA